VASREIRHLSAAMQVLYNKFADRVRRDVELQKLGVTMLLTCTHRSNEEQAKLYAQGRTAPGRIVTNAKPGSSAHNAETPQGDPAAEAVDIVPLLHGKPMWSMANVAATPENEKWIWDRIGEHGMAAGLKWYGAPGSAFFEGAHFQNPAWRKP
jgi:peptidoglycan L-alanyl-D-glutamate endopeptidase CwlK